MNDIDGDIPGFIAERDAALLSMSRDKIVAFITKWNGASSVPDDRTFWAAVHKSRTAVASLPEYEWRASVEWLKSRGFSHFADDLAAAPTRPPRFCKACRGTGKLAITGPLGGRGIRSCVVCDGWGWRDLCWARENRQDHVVTVSDTGADRSLCGINIAFLAPVDAPNHRCQRCLHVLDIQAADQRAEDDADGLSALRPTLSCGRRGSPGNSF